jgi:putative transposase
MLVVVSDLGFQGRIALRRTIMRKSRFRMVQILGILEEAEAGHTPAELCRRYGVAAETFYRWRAQYDGMPISDLKRLKPLEEENTQLKRLVAEQALDILALKVDLSKKY